MVVRAQLGDLRATAGSTALDVLRRCHLVQLDGLSTVEKSHRLTCAVRMPAGATGAAIDHSLWSSGPAVSFETYTHAACLFPVEDWPCLALHREAARKRSQSLPVKLVDDVLDRVAASPAGLSMREIEAGSAASQSWAWSDRKRAAECLVWTGRLVCSTRAGGHRIYDLTERRVPATLTRDLSRDETLAGLGQRALESLGVATVGDIAFHYNVRPEVAEEALGRCEAVPVDVEGWDAPGWVLDSARTDRTPCPVAHDPVLIGPFDGLLRDRERAARIFDFRYTLEAYKPAARREYGPYAMAVLAGSRITGRTDLRRTHGRLIVNAVHPEPGERLAVVEEQVHVAAARLAALLGPACPS